jgi:hypothetical protein
MSRFLRRACAIAAKRQRPGGFDDHREYVVISTGKMTPPPWSNVPANEDFACLFQSRGCTRGNSQLNRPMPQSNDPVSTRPASAIDVRDDETGDLHLRRPSHRDDGPTPFSMAPVTRAIRTAATDPAGTPVLCPRMNPSRSASQTANEASRLRVERHGY